MPVLTARLPATLNTPVSLDPTMDAQVAREVARTPSFLTPVPGWVVPPKAPTPVHPGPVVGVRPIDVLHTLGTAMLPPRHVRQRLASWHWTLLRYAYLIEQTTPANAPFATNALVGDYRYHHMVAVSEAFGVACALSYARGWLEHVAGVGAIVHQPLDLEYLLSPGAVALPGAAAGIVPMAMPGATRRPDYLIVAERAAQARLMLVECKGGSSGGRGQAIDQLGAAMHQLASITFGGTRAIGVARHAYAAQISKAGGPIAIYGVDPEDPGEPWITPDRPSGEEEMVAERDERGARHLPPPERVSGYALRRIDDRACAWAGVADTAEEVDVETLDAVESDVGDLIGATSRFAAPDGQAVEIFTGVHREVITAAAAPDDDPARTARPTIRLLGSEIAPGARARASRSFSLRGEDPDPERIASAITEDGLALHVEVRGRER